jgi:hypothetical protein
MRDVTLSLAFHAGRYAEGLRQAPHWHDELHLSLVLQGHIAETVGGSTEFAGALSVVAKDPGVVHEDRFGPRGATVARLSIAGRGIADLVEAPERGFGWRWAHDLAVAAPFLRLARRADARDVAFDATDDDVVELLAALTARPARRAAGLARGGAGSDARGVAARPPRDRRGAGRRRAPGLSRPLRPPLVREQHGRPDARAAPPEGGAGDR